MKRSILLTILILSGFLCIGQERVTVSGYVKDADTGETLIGASIYNKKDPVEGVSSNTYGFYSITLEKGKYTLAYTFMGYTSVELSLDLQKDTSINVELTEGVVLSEVTITGENEDENVSSTDMGKVDLEIEALKRLPVLLGEVDVLKAIQLLPGVLSAGEGNAGFFVRGGGPDQNLIMLDDAVIYNSGHLLGFFSVFNSDAIKNTTLIKGGMPAQYGGRLSSVVDVQMRDGNDKYFQASGGIGLVASRLTLEGPIVKDKISFLVSGRRTYAFDLAQPFLKETAVAGTNYYFYDANAKLNIRFSDKDRLYLSGYFGRDVLNFNSDDRGFSFQLPYGNNTATLRWNHVFSDRLFMNASAIYNEYQFEIEGEQDQFRLKFFSGVRDYSGKVDFDWYLNNRHQIKFGFQYAHHKLTPNIAQASSGDVELSNNLQPKYGQELSLYLQDKWKVNQQLTINAGLRGTVYAQTGPFTDPVDSITYGTFDVVQQFGGLEPRLTARYLLSPVSSLKAGISVAYQYLHLVSNSTSTLPLDVWVTSSNQVEPQLGIQYSAGYFLNLADNNYETSIEAYYKDLRNQIDYGESFVNNPSTEVEQDFVFGNGRAYGLELFFKKRYGKLNGWIGYSLARTERWFPDVEDGRVYPAVYDRTHDLSIVLNYAPSAKWDIGAVFVYGTGRAFTPIESLFIIEQNLNVNYGPRNSDRLDNYHRMDLSATYYPTAGENKNFESSWTFSIYNVYNRRNPFFIYTTFDTDIERGTASAGAVKVSLFPIIPSMTWNFKWKAKKNNVKKK